MSFYSLTSRNNSSYSLPNLSVGNLLLETGDELLTESGNSILLENPSNNPNLSQRNTKPSPTWGEMTELISEDTLIWGDGFYPLPLRHV